MIYKQFCNIISYNFLFDVFSFLANFNTLKLIRLYNKNKQNLLLNINKVLLNQFLKLF